MCLGPGTEIQGTGNLFCRKIGLPICSPICWEFLADWGGGFCDAAFFAVSSSCHPKDGTSTPSPPRPLWGACSPWLSAAKSPPIPLNPQSSPTGSPSMGQRPQPNPRTPMTSDPGGPCSPKRPWIRWSRVSTPTSQARRMLKRSVFLWSPQVRAQGGSEVWWRVARAWLYGCVCMCCTVWREVWCDVVRCAKGADTKKAMALGCFPHVKMQKAWALILKPKTNRMPCLLGDADLVHRGNGQGAAQVQPPGRGQSSESGAWAAAKARHRCPPSPQRTQPKTIKDSRRRVVGVCMGPTAAYPQQCSGHPTPCLRALYGP